MNQSPNDLTRPSEGSATTRDIREAFNYLVSLIVNAQNGTSESLGVNMDVARLLIALPLIEEDQTPCQSIKLLASMIECPLIYDSRIFQRQFKILQRQYFLRENATLREAQRKGRMTTEDEHVIARSRAHLAAIELGRDEHCLPRMRPKIRSSLKYLDGFFKSSVVVPFPCS
jgi:hypothetical protein